MNRIIMFVVVVLIGIAAVPIVKTFIDDLSGDVTTQPELSLMQIIPLALLLFVFIAAIIGEGRKQ